MRFQNNVESFTITSLPTEEIAAVAMSHSWSLPAYKLFSNSVNGQKHTHPQLHTCLDNIYVFFYLNPLVH